MLNTEIDEFGEETPRIAGFIDVISAVALVFILMTSLLTIVLYKKTLDSKIAKEQYAKTVRTLNTTLERNKRLSDSLQTTKIVHFSQAQKYKFIADSLLREIEKRRITKIIIPNELEGKVFFESGKATIRREFHSTLNRFYRLISDSLNSGHYNLVQVEGHTDDVPIHTNLYRDNWDLGAARSISVVRYLVAKGIPPQFLSATTHSEFKPFNPSTTMIARSQNRRIEIVLLKK